ncbi:MAG TPA: sulfur transferase domain-containing protein [Nevskiaceae bacterium]|nr:sulfur transferase domain-containing protein [Nevskiaceae bacterium]
MPALTGRYRLRAWLEMLFVDHAIFRLFFNRRCCIAPNAYRSSHPLPCQVRAGARAGVRTILNLRGPDPGNASNRLEWEAARACGVQVLHLSLNSRDAPEVADLLGLVEIFRHAEAPLWLHCKSGADRAGLAATVYQLAVVGKPLREARRELSLWRHGHVRQAKTGILDHFFDCYAAAQARDGVGFLQWLVDSYDRDAVRRSFRERWWASVVVDRLLRRE